MSDDRWAVKPFDMDEYYNFIENFPNLTQQDMMSKFGQFITEDMYNKLPEDIKRHYKKVKEMNSKEILNRVLAVLPYADQIQDVDTSDERTLRFTWRGDSFKVTKNGFLQIEDCILVGSNLTIVLNALVDLS